LEAKGSWWRRERKRRGKEKQRVEMEEEGGSPPKLQTYLRHYQLLVSTGEPTQDINTMKE
jgi:hypothetical protein